MLGIAGQSNARGCRVTHVAEKSPAANAGIAVGDIVVRIDGGVVKDFASLINLVGKHAVGDKVRVELLRQDEKLNFGRRMMSSACPSMI